MAVGIVVVTQANVEMSMACLRSVADDIAEHHRVVVVNDAQALRPAGATTLRAMACVMVTGSQCGYGENVNRGAAALPADVESIVVTNDDVIFAPGAIGVLLASLAERRDAAIVGPAVYGEDGSAQASTFAFPSVMSEVSQELILPTRAATQLRARYARPAAAAKSEVDWVLGAAFLVRRSAFEAVGGFDSRYFLYSEETDLCYRLTRADWRVLSEGRARVTHLGGVSTGGGDRRRMSISRGLYIKQHWNTRQMLFLRALWPLVSLWNFGYVMARIIARPQEMRAKCELLTEHRQARAAIGSVGLTRRRCRDG